MTPGEAAYERTQVAAREAENAALPEITVTGAKIPWWVWTLAGSLAVLVLISERRSKRT